MKVSVAINKGTIMFVIGLVLFIASISTAVFAQKPKAQTSGWQYKLVDYHGPSQTTDGWEPLDYIPASGNDWPKVFVRKPSN
ncbi:MAG: hypothetical protein JST12_05625 [Armatimonadetes bacterium]|nr:hypothetical protein [Armatimonadota bacterium]